MERRNQKEVISWFCAIKKESGTYKFGDIDLGRNYEDIDEYLLKNKEFTNTLRDLVVETMVLLYK